MNTVAVPVSQQLDPHSIALSCKLVLNHPHRDVDPPAAGSAAADDSDLKDKLNNIRSKGKKKKGLGVHAELLISAESRERHAAEEEERREKARKEEEAKASKAVKTAEHQAQMARLNGTEVFAGALGSKSKSDLQLIVAALSLSIDGKSERSLI
ncbi:hypothetical protein SERLADRAFT_434577 [Serpula lacrymans var. lacrymans S7.9]|uniref:Uncharacterized protein n=1 Tax=Serpula lacrymans var. lacrymans (strain S7.9) TaxID=578457 RepID=F8NJT0_SERL9|nr:uncharacterized protein SERLADRAFT_434577 [Serpula lacrymans var. lacrymans S7.9]EGO28666.1 hypothetical protein SERLADRAFT_434577 [Serpula lacrymans var. lacrymans S7.9]